jgi:hypothetical protein
MNLVPDALAAGGWPHETGCVDRRPPWKIVRNMAARQWGIQSLPHHHLHQTYTM